MKELFFNKAKNNEEYKKVIKARMNISALIFVIGVITLSVTLLTEYTGKVILTDYIAGVYTGVGTGLMVVSAIMWVKNKRILSDDEKLKISRLNNTDERIQDISSKAFRLAGIILLITLYVVGLVGGIFYPILTELLLSLGCVFLVTYIVAYKIYEKRM